MADGTEAMIGLTGTLLTVGVMSHVAHESLHLPKHKHKKNKKFKVM